MAITFFALAALFAATSFFALSYLENQSESGVAFRLLRKMTARDGDDPDRDGELDRLLLGQRIRSYAPGLDERFARPLLHAAGYYTEREADLVALLWVALIIVGFMLALMLPGPTPALCFASLVVGVFGPSFYLRFRARQRRTTIARGLPDVIDLLVVCVEAGLGLDQAVLRVSEELAETHPELHIEFGRLLQHQRAGMPRLEAWQRMGERLLIPEMDAFVGMILQAERFGTPIARALSEFAALVRQKRTQAAEQAAAKTTVKISFPLILFIFPCIFIVLLGPAFLNAMRSLTSLFH